MEFFKETALYKEMLLLEYISNNSSISQPDIARHIDSAVSMTHNYIETCEKNGFLLREYQSKKVVHYKITSKGIKRKNYLQIRYMKQMMDLFIQSKVLVHHFLQSIIDKNFKRICLYGAGEVAEVILDIIKMDDALDLEVVAIVDDDPNKLHTEFNRFKVISPEDLKSINHDGVVIASYTFESEIIEKLDKMGYPNDKIVKYFEKE